MLLCVAEGSGIVFASSMLSRCVFCFYFPFFESTHISCGFLYETNKNNERNKIFLVSFPPCRVCLTLYNFSPPCRIIQRNECVNSIFTLAALWDLWVIRNLNIIQLLFFFAFLHMSGFSFLPCCDTSPSHQKQRNTFLTENFNITWARVRKFSFIFFPPVFFILDSGYK